MVRSVTYQRETRTVPFQGKTLCWKALPQCFPQKRRRNGKKRLSAVCMTCSASTARAGADPDNIALRGYQWYNILVRLVAPFP